MKWYEERYVNHRDWILDHLETLGLNAQETVIVLLIDFMNQHQQMITINALSKRTGMKETEVNQTIAMLCAKKYMDIKASSGYPKFILNGLFETDTARVENVLDESLFDVFETNFARPLTPNEMQKISEWNRDMDKQMILYALRRAVAYDHKNISYIDRILQNWTTKGVTLEMIEEGQA